MIEKAKEILINKFKLDSFRSGQEEIIKHCLNGNSSLVIMPTGGGKSLCYQISALSFDGLTLVISPLISLMKDQVDQLKKLNIDATYINSSIDKEERIKRYKNVSDSKYKLVYVSPERFRKDDFLKALKNVNISLIVIDEAHCISQWGNDFRPDYKRINRLVNSYPNTPIMALTATATEAVQTDILNELNRKNKPLALFHEGIERSNLILQAKAVYGDSEKLNEIINYCHKNKGSIIVYFSKIKHLAYFSDVLETKKIPHLVYHGDLNSDQRRRTQRQFMEASNSLILATNAFGMGINKADIRAVIHAELPDSLEAYYQEIGRAGRDGKASDCILLYDEQDIQIQMEFIEWQNPNWTYLQNCYDFIESHEEEVNSMGIDYLRENLVFKNKRDNRLESALNLFDRFDITSGNIEQKNLKIKNDLEHEYFDLSSLELKKKQDQMRLYELVKYANATSCRMQVIHSYFNHYLDKKCGKCDICQSDN